MVKKLEENPITNQNINNNHNNINIDVKVERPKTIRKAKPKEKPKPNWVIKAIVLGVIGLTISLLGYYLKGGKSDGKHNPAVIENGSPAIKGEKVN